MTYKDPLTLYPELEQRIARARTQVTICRSGADLVRRNLQEQETTLGELEEIARIQEGLARRDKDPGKYGSAYAYAALAVRDSSGKVIDALRSAEPHEIQVIDGQEYPLLIKYEQTEDGPDGDLWEKEFFVLTHRGIVPLGHAVSAHRF